MPLYRRVLRWAGLILAGLSGLVVVLALAGLAFEALSAGGDAKRYPIPGKLVDIGGGVRLHLNCVGTGSPTVILDSGLGGTSLDWTLVQPRIAMKTRACSYDRAGMGWSDPGVMPRTPKRIADELRTLLTNAHIGGPYVLVGHSLGGKNIRMFAIEHPDETAGLVLVDARNEYMDFHAKPADRRQMAQQLQSGAWQYRAARTFGIVRLLGASLAGPVPLPHATVDTLTFLSTRQKAIDAVGSEGSNRATDDVTLRDHASLGDRPLIVLAAGENMKASADWRAAQKLQSSLSARGRLIVVQNSGHYIQWAEPKTVIAAIAEVVSAVRNRVPAPP